MSGFSRVRSREGTPRACGRGGAADGGARGGRRRAIDYRAHAQIRSREHIHQRRGADEWWWLHAKDWGCVMKTHNYDVTWLNGNESGQLKHNGKIDSSLYKQRYPVSTVGSSWVHSILQHQTNLHFSFWISYMYGSNPLLQQRALQLSDPLLLGLQSRPLVPRMLSFGEGLQRFGVLQRWTGNPSIGSMFAFPARRRVPFIGLTLCEPSYLFLSLKAICCISGALS